MYAQKLEGDTWREERLDKERIDRMSGCSPFCVIVLRRLTLIRSATGPIIRIDAGYSEERGTW
jgi:hypothetical protein